MGSVVSCHKTSKKTLELNQEFYRRPDHQTKEENNLVPQAMTHHYISETDKLPFEKENNQNNSDELNVAGKTKKSGLVEVAENAKLTAPKRKKTLKEQNQNTEDIPLKVKEISVNEETILEESVDLRNSQVEPTQVDMQKNSNSSSKDNKRENTDEDIRIRTFANVGDNCFDNNRPSENATGFNLANSWLNDRIPLTRDCLENNRPTNNNTHNDTCTTNTRGIIWKDSIDENVADSKGILLKEHPKAQPNSAISTNTEPSLTDKGQILLNKLCDQIGLMKDKRWVTDEGQISKGGINILGALQPISENAGVLSKSADILLETKTIEEICELIIYIQQQVTKNQFNEKIQTLCFTMGVALGVLVNYTDSSEKIAEKITHYPGFLDTLRDILVKFSEKTLHENIAITEEDITLTCIINNALSVVYNISLVDSNVSRLRQHHFTEALQPYLQSSDKDDHLTALAALAGIINEKESEIINSNRKVVKYLMKVLRRALRADDRRYAGWSCKELAVVIKTLARNDANKRLLVQLGALELLVDLTQGTTQETIEAVGAIWALSFDAENRKEMLENEALLVISTLSRLRESDCDKVASAASGALWNLRNDLLTSNKNTYKSIGEEIIAKDHAPSKPSKTADGSDHRAGHIMVSYQWGNQKTLLEIRDGLIKHGFKVWMDIDNMAGSTLQAMAEAVENADLVLLCYSQKYKNSPNCRAEAEYTFQRQKPFLPLRMEPNYKPDGWLGILVGTKLFYDFSGKYEFRGKLDQLLKEIGRLKNQGKTIDSAIVPVIPSRTEPLYHKAEVQDDRSDSYHGVTHFPAVTEISDMIRTWTTDDVRNWLRKHNLSEHDVGEMPPDEVALLVEMKNEAPEAFYKTLQKKFNYDLRMMSQMVVALKAIDT